MSAKKNVLVVLTSHNQLGGTGKPTGWYLPEFAHPYYELEPHVNFTIASPRGGNAPLDPASVEAFKQDDMCSKFLEDKKELWEKTEMLFKFLGKADQFDAVFYVGGHGPMYDLANDGTSIAIIKEFYEKGKIVSAVCHGPAVFKGVTLASGEHLLHGQPVTGFSNDEEDAVGLSNVMPFMLETELKAKGGVYEKADQPWGAKVSVARGGKLITGNLIFIPPQLKCLTFTSASHGD
ncbi:hypothetical protein H072_409 [Dactylellina haptotyla CBS 200.50]|uniref:D-lactate dehydratase n=1 Tax=Dactylellina haptotyla (strain CBS 200.50) TaxID=1284197 RepID=S8ARV1_DACHA|nr:hypothetical protein H072_409 [Dactylellina haptotyla CBS 200.50]